jgi:hypothetical protein
MTVGQFAEAVAVYRRKYDASETSAGRTDAHSIAVGGVAGDAHNWDLGRDLVYPHGPNRKGAETHPRLPHSCPLCSENGLKVIHESAPAHDHLQPADFPAGSVAIYDGVRKTWT